jgi:predicted CopG family antitoxin
MEVIIMRKKIYTRQVGVLFSEDIYQELIRITDEIEISVSEFIRQTVEEKLKLANTSDNLFNGGCENDQHKKQYSI